MPARFGVASGHNPTELAASLNEAASFGLTEIAAMTLGPRGEVWAIVATDGDGIGDELDQDAHVPPPLTPPAATQPATQVVSATTGRPVKDETPPRRFATGEENPQDKPTDPLTPPPTTDGPATRKIGLPGRG